MAAVAEATSRGLEGVPSGSPLWRVLGLLDGVKKGKGGYKAICPAHDDHEPSLGVTVGNDSRVLLYCRRGCTTDMILGKLGLGYPDLFEKSREGNRIRRFRIMDRTGRVVHHVREELPSGKKKDLWWESGGHRGLDGLPSVDLALYRAETLADTDPSAPVIVCEGEADAEALADVGLVAVGTVTGASTIPGDASLECLRGRCVWLWPDHDEPGQEHMAAIATRLEGLGADVRWIRWADAPEHGGAADFLRAGGTAQDIAALVELPPQRSNGHVRPEPEEEPIPPFPLDALPLALKGYVEESSTALVAPPDLVAVPLITLAGAVIGNARQLEVKRGWREGPNLYTAVITPPGGKKTPSGSAAKRPIYRVQDRLKREHEEAAQRHREEVAEWEALSKVGRAGQKPPEPPRFGHVVTTDATTEAIAAMLQGCKGLVLERDELSGWTRSMDQYRAGKGADRQHFLSMWSRGALKVDRKGAPPIFVPNPCLSVTGGIQPDMLSELIDSSGREDGFIDRILLSYPAEMPDRWTEDEVSLETLMAVEDLFERLYSLPDESGSEAGVVRLAADARALWRDWYEANAAEMQAPDFPGHLRGAWAKMPSQFLRIALILHVVTYPEALVLPLHIAEETAEIIAYFKGHARRVYGCLGSARRDMGARILEATVAYGGTISADELRSEVFQRNYPAARIRDELDRLVAAGRLTYQKRTDTGGRPREEWSHAE